MGRLGVAVLVAVSFLGVHQAVPRALGDQSTEQSFSIGSSWPPGVQEFLRLEMGQPVFNVGYRYGENRSAANGAYGPNVTAPRSAWFLEYQRAGGTDVIAGVLHRDSRMIAEGLKMFHFGLARETKSGSFPGSAWPFHGTAMFLAEAAPALIVLKYSPSFSSFRAEFGWEVPRMRRAVYQMVRAVHGPGHIDDSTKNHRFYEAAIALGAVGVLTGDRVILGWSRRYATEGIAMEHSNGVMPENGGHDSGYQALGMVYATRYLELVASGTLQRKLYRTLSRGETWELSRIRGNGSVNQSGDTRSADCRERNPEGRCKTTMFAPIFNALARWAVVDDRPRYASAAYMVWLQNWQLVPGDVLPRPGLWSLPTSVRSGQWLTVWGTRFKPLEAIRVYLGTTLEQTVTADQIGSFGGHSPQPNAHFIVPRVPGGSYVITARGSLGTTRAVRITVS